MKKLTAISLFIYWAVVTALLVAGLVFYQNSRSGSAVNSLGGSNVLGNVVLSQAEIAKHNLANDCWMIINNKVYNVTSYISVHPGGAGTIVPYCGQEATQAFDTKGGRGNSHSNSAASMLANYYLGDLNQKIGNQQIQQTNSVVPSGRLRGGNEFNDD